MTVLEWLQELEEDERIVKVGCVDNTCLLYTSRCLSRQAGIVRCCLRFAVYPVRHRRILFDADGRRDCLACRIMERL